MNIELLSEIRSKYNCFDEKEEPYYRALTEAIEALMELPPAHPSTDRIYAELSKVYNIKELPDEAISIVGDLMLSLDEPSVRSEIVKCKDCMHRPIKKDGDIVPPKEDDWKCPFLCDDYYYSRIPRDDFFCANAERSEE